MIELKDTLDMFEKNPLSQAVVDNKFTILLVNDGIL